MTIKAKINKLGIMVATAILFATTGSYAESPTQSISENKSPTWVKNAVFYCAVCHVVPDSSVSLQ